MESFNPSGDLHPSGEFSSALLKDGSKVLLDLSFATLMHICDAAIDQQINKAKEYFADRLTAVRSRHERK